MYATFVAHGPFSTNVKDVKGKQPTSLFRRKNNKGWHSIQDSAYVMEGFENVQIYGLVMKLLGLEEFSAKNNATIGFWDKYF